MPHCRLTTCEAVYAPQAIARGAPLPAPMRLRTVARSDDAISDGVAPLACEEIAVASLSPMLRPLAWPNRPCPPSLSTVPVPVHRPALCRTNIGQCRQRAKLSRPIRAGLRGALTVAIGDSLAGQTHPLAEKPNENAHLGQPRNFCENP